MGQMHEAPQKIIKEFSKMLLKNSLLMDFLTGYHCQMNCGYSLYYITV